jgi:hypothetical protein
MFQYQIFLLIDLIHIIDGFNMGMIKGGDSFGFLLETGDILGGGIEMGGQEFKGHIAVQFGVMGPVYNTHSTLT